MKYDEVAGVVIGKSVTALMYPAVILVSMHRINCKASDCFDDFLPASAIEELVEVHGSIATAAQQYVMESVV